MGALSVSPVSPAAVGVFATPNAVIQPVAAPSSGKSDGSSALSVQDLAQSLFRRTLQATTLYAVSEPASGSVSLTQDATASLLAALTPPLATANTTPTPSATTNPTVTQTSNTSSSAPPATSLQELPTNQDAFDTSLSPDFAMQTALRFGAGVVTEAAVSAVPSTNLGTGLVRDATSVLRLGSLQPRSSGPGLETFAQPQTAAQRVLRSYETSSVGSVAQDANTLDLLA
jgi:hypothetical protein